MGNSEPACSTHAHVRGVLSGSRCAASSLLMLPLFVFMLLSASQVWAVPSSTPVSECGTLDSGGNYYLTQDVSSDGTCFTIAANSVTLDCNGYTITYSQTTGGYGVDINAYNFTTVKNCNIIQGGTDSGSYGIIIESSSNNTIMNNTVTNINNFGITLSNSSNNTLTSNTITTSGSSSVSGIYLEVSSNNTFTSNNITGTGSFGIYITEASSNNTLNNNTITTTGYVSGIYLEFSSNNNTFAGNIITGVYCIYVSTSSADNLFYNNLINGTTPIALDSAGANYWNTTLTNGTNIAGGPWIGGNFYGQPENDGYSQTCLDDNLDIICDSGYNLDGEMENNIDYLPLAQPQPMGTITGTVLNPSGDPVTGADVHAEGTSISTTTDANGEYTLSLLVGVYDVTVSKYQIYLSSSIYGIVVNEDEATPAPLVSLQYNYIMGCGGSAAIAGRILNSTGGGISGATVYVYPQMSGGGMQGAGEGGKGVGGDISTCYGSASSDDNGSYFVFGLKAGIYTISVSPPYDSDYGSKDARDIIISGENETVSYNATLSLGGKIFGKIINAGGSGLANMDVYAYTMSGEGYGSTQTMNGCAAVSNCSVWNNYLDGYCSMAGCFTMSAMCDGTADMSCSDIPTICSGNVNCDLISEEPSCQNGCDWNATAHCQGTPNSCSYGDSGECTDAGCSWNDEYCGGTVDCGSVSSEICEITGCSLGAGSCSGEEGCSSYASQVDCETNLCSWTPGPCTGSLGCGSFDSVSCGSTPGCIWNPEVCYGDPTACDSYSNDTDCGSVGCTWDVADCQGFPDCSPISTGNCSGVSGCNLMNEDCMQVSGCALNNYCTGTPTGSCGDYEGEESCMNSGAGCGWNSGYCSGSPPSCDSLGVDNCISASGCEWSGTDCTGSPSYFCDMGEGMCPTYPGCSWTPGYCSGEIFSCGSYYSDVSCAGVGCLWLPVCESNGGSLECFAQDTKDKCDIVTGCTYSPYCSGTPDPCNETNDSSTCASIGCSMVGLECTGTPNACAGQSFCSPGCYWNSDPCQGVPSNGWQCDQQSDQGQCETSACAWNASNIGKFTLRGLMLGTYSIQAQPQYWLQPPSEYGSKIFTDIATISEEGEMVDVFNLTLGTAGVLKGCVTDAAGNPTHGVYLNAYSMDAGFGWGQTESLGCTGTTYLCEDASTNETCLAVGCGSWSDTATEAGEYCYDTCQDVIEQGVCEGYNCTWDGSCYNDTASSATDKAACEGTGVGVWKGCTGTPYSCEHWDFDGNGCPGSYGCTWATKACYRITGLTTGTYIVEAYSPWLNLPRTTIENVAVTEGEDTDLNISFGVPSSIYGYVQNAEGAGVPDVYFNVITEGAGPYSPPEDWGWEMAKTVGCSGTPTLNCDFIIGEESCNSYNTIGCYFDPGDGNCKGTVTACNGYPLKNDQTTCLLAGCSWDNRAFYNVSGLKGSDTRKYVVIAMPGYYNWYHNTSYSQKVNSSVTLPVGGSVEVNFTMTTGGSISGRVTDGSGNPITAGLGAYMPYSEGQIAYGISGWDRTDADGYYNITGLPAGTYEVQAYPWSGGFTSGHATVTVGEGDDYNLDFTLGAGGRISGRIIENGSAISSAIVEVWSQDASFFAYGAAGVDSDGTFLVSGLDPADDYTATIRKISAYGGQESPTYISGISVVADQTTELGDITLIPVNGGIYGNATYADGSAIPNADVYAWSKDTMAFGWAQTNGSGYYSITGLPPGTYDTMLNLWSLGLANKFTSIEVGSDPVLHNFGLASSVSIYGYVTGGGPISGAEVNIWNSETNVGMRDTTDANGLYNITIDSGTGYSMSIIVPGYGTYFNDSVDFTDDTELDVSLTSMSGSTTYNLEGNVTYSNGTGISGASVVAYGGETASYFNVTDNSGAFTIGGMLGDRDYNVTAIVGSTQSNATVTVGVPADWTDAGGNAISVLMHVPFVG